MKVAYIGLRLFRTVTLGLAGSLDGEGEGVGSASTVTYTVLVTMAGGGEEEGEGTGVGDKGTLMDGIDEEGTEEDEHGKSGVPVLLEGVLS